MVGHDLFWDMLSVAASIIAMVSLIVAIINSTLTPRGKWLVGCVSIMAVGSLSAWRMADRLTIEKGKFEWQWAGENWYGTVKIDDDRHGRVVATDVHKIRKAIENGVCVYRSEPVLWSSDGRLYGDKRGFDIEMQAIQKVDGKNVPVALRAELYPVEAYAGTVTYYGKKEPCNVGDMVLVRYTSGLRLR